MLAYLLGLLLLPRQFRSRPPPTPLTTQRSGPPSIRSISAPLPGSGLLRRGSVPLDDAYERPLTAARTISSDRVGLGGRGVGGEDEEGEGWGEEEGGVEMSQREKWTPGQAL